MKLRLENLLTKIYFGAILIALPVVSFAAQEVRENKSARFSETLSETGAQSTNKSNSTLAEMIREQRAKLDNQETAAIATASGIQNVNACDTDLRKCMQEKCGNDFSKCFTDSESIWGGKMDACRRNTKCTSHEYALLVPEIKADRDLNVQMGEYQKIVKCGQEYNACIFKNCGTTMDNCIAKTDGDAAISKCKSIADKCKSQDSGLPSRATDVFATLRKHAQEQARADEKRLYELRDKMESVCKAQGAIFDNRTLDCVFTVNFYADNAKTPTASKKLYSGSVFQCTPEWFGIDVTTFKENAYRLTRSEKAASSAALGAGLGTAGGMLASGALDRAVQEKGWNFGKLGGKNNDDANNSEACEKNQTWDETTKACVNASNNEQKAGTKMTEAEKAACEGSAGTPHINPVTGNEICKCPRETHNISGDYKTCIKIDDQPSDNGTPKPGAETSSKASEDTGANAAATAAAAATTAPKDTKNNSKTKTDAGKAAKKTENQKKKADQEAKDKEKQEKKKEACLNSGGTDYYPNPRDGITHCNCPRDKGLGGFSTCVCRQDGYKYDKIQGKCVPTERQKKKEDTAAANAAKLKEDQKNLEELNNLTKNISDRIGVK